MQITRIGRICANVVLIGCACLVLSCEEEYVSTIPIAPVNIKLNLNTEDSDLIPLLATKSFTQPRIATDRIGFGGVLVIQGDTQLYAYDLACPVEANRNIKVIPNDVGQATCPHCKSVYDLAYGSGMPHSGTKLFLKSYPVIATGYLIYQISN